MSKMKEEFIKQRENAYAMGRCDDLYQEHLAEKSFCQLETERETVLKCAEWMMSNVLDEYVDSRMMREYWRERMVKELLHQNSGEIPF